MTSGERFAAQCANTIRDELDGDLHPRITQTIARLFDEAVGRQPVSMTTEHGQTLLICNDGTTWQRLNSEWVEVGPPLPGSLASKE